MKYQIFIALKHLTRRRRSGFISLISVISVTGVALGVMALIVVMAVMSGFDHELRSKIIGMNPHLIIQKVGGISETSSVINKIKEIDPQEIKNVTPYVQGQVLVRSKSNAVGAILRGVSMNEEGIDSLSFVEKHLVRGDLNLKEYPKGKEPVGSIAVGLSLARMLGVRVGETVEIISPHFTEKKGFTGKMAKAESFVVEGVFELGMNEFDTTLILANLASVQKLFKMNGRVTGVSAQLKDTDRTEEFKWLIRNKLKAPFFVQTWEDMNRNFFSALKVEKAVMRILLTLIVMVAAFNIISTLIMVVMEKTKEIGILRSLGATKAGVQSIFLLEGFTIGAFGTLFGGLLGFYLAKNINTVADIVEKFTGFEVFPKDIYYFSQIPVQIIPSDIFFIIFFALLMALAAAFYPAYQAGRVSPVESIRYE